LAKLNQADLFQDNNMQSIMLLRAQAK